MVYHHRRIAVEKLCYCSLLSGPDGSVAHSAVFNIAALNFLVHNVHKRFVVLIAANKEIDLRKVLKSIFMQLFGNTRDIIRRCEFVDFKRADIIRNIFSVKNTYAAGRYAHLNLAEQHYFLCAVRLGYDRSRRETRLPRPVHSVQNACFRALSTVHGLHRRDSDRLPAVRCHDDSVRHKYRYHD